MRLAFQLGNEFKYVGWRTKVGFCKAGWNDSFRESCCSKTPLNLPSERLENHGLDLNVEIVPKGTLSWGSRASSSGSNAWLSSAPNADGENTAHSHVSGRPSSGGSGIRPSTSESDRTNVPVANAWGSNSRPSTASGSLTSNQTSLCPKSAETRPNSSQVSRFSEPASECSTAWGASGVGERLGVKSYKVDGFSLSSGYFPTLGSEKENSVMNTKSQENCRPSLASERTAWAKEEDAKFHADGQRGTMNTLRTDGPRTAEDGIFPRMENWQGEPQQYFNTNIPSQHFDAWRSPLFNGPAGPWYRGRPPGPAFRGHVAPGGFPMEPFPYYPPQISHPAVCGAHSVPLAGSGPRGTHPRNGDLFRPPMPDAYARPGIPFRPGFYRGPSVPPGQMTFEGYYGPPSGYCSNEPEIPFMTPRPPSYNGFQALGVHDPNFPGGSIGHGPSGETLPVRMEADHQSLQSVPSKNHNDWYQKDEEETWDGKVYLDMHMHLKSLFAQFTKPNQTLSSTRILHCLIIKNSLYHDPFYATKITRFYALNKDLISARNLFDETPQQSIYLWNSIIRAYARAHKFFDAFLLFKRLLVSEIKPDNYTFACILRACSESLDFQGVRVVHGKMIVSGLGLDYICNSSLVSCYSKLSLVAEASSTFFEIDEPDLVLWNAIISCYGSSGDLAKGIELFNEMLKLGKRPDGYTIVGLMMRLADQSLLKLGEVVHGFCVKCGLIMNDHVGSVLVCVYSRCKNMDLACSVFDSLLQPDLVTWSALITGFSQAGDYVNALIFFTKLLMGGASADSVLLVSVLAASSQLAILGPGCEIHGYAVRHERDTEVMVSSALVDMYAKCGFLESGIRVFRNMVDRNIVSYNSVISGLGLYGRADEAFKVFEELLENGIKPDEATFCGLLCACCHTGLVNKGRQYFERMRDEFGIQAKTEHHVYMVKILGMDGQLREAYGFIKSLPEPVHCSVWGALLSCCDAYSTNELSEVIADHLIENKWRNRCYDVMLSNLYAGKGRWNDVKQLRVDSGGAKGKIPGISWIGV